MRIRAAVVFCLGLWLSATALADTYYRYRDQRTGRDVFVNRLDQVPRRYRGSAKIVFQTDDGAAEAEPPSTEVIDVPPKPGRPILRTVSPTDRPALDFRHAFAFKEGWRAQPVLLGNMMDAKLAASGAPRLTGAERHGLGILLVVFLIAAVIAGLAALVAWIVVIVSAFRNDHPWWGVCTLIFSPVAYLYLFLHVGKGRTLFKSLCAGALLSPALVTLAGAWRFYAWFQAVVQARGGHL